MTTCLRWEGAWRFLQCGRSNAATQTRLTGTEFSCGQKLYL